MLVQMVLYLSKSLSLSIWKDINSLFLSLYPYLTRRVLTYKLIPVNTKTNDLITLS